MGYRWRGFEHPELYKMINTGPGPQASDPQTEYWKTLSDELSQVDQDLNTRLSQLGSRWEGTAAQSAQTGLTPLAEWAGDAELGSDVMRISTENQGEYIADARAKMPEPVEVTTQAPSGWDRLAAGAAAATGNLGPAADVAAQAADHEAEEAAQSEAEQRAIETMRTYESSSTWNRETLGTFVAPPDVVVSTPQPQGSGTVSAVVIGSTTRTVRSGSGTSTGGGTSKPPTFQGGTDTPHVDTADPGGGETGGGTVGGGTVNPGIPSVPNPTTTTPQDVFVPPVTGGGGGGGPLPPYNQLPPNPGPSPYPNPGQPPYLGGPNLPFGPGDNASDIARRALPLRPGLPGLPGQGGPFGGPGGFPGGAGGAGAFDAERAPSQLGRGGLPGGGIAGEGGVVRNGPGAAGAAGRGGNGVHGPAGAGGRRAEGEEDDEHFAPDYLLESDDVFGDDRRVSPTVIGE